MVGISEGWWLGEQERCVSGREESLCLRGERGEREEFEDCLRVGEECPFFPFCEEFWEVSKNLRAIVLYFLGVWACMSSLNIIFLLRFFSLYNGYRYI